MTGNDDSNLNLSVREADEVCVLVKGAGLPGSRDAATATDGDFMPPPYSNNHNFVSPLVFSSPPWQASYMPPTHYGRQHVGDAFHHGQRAAPSAPHAAAPSAPPAAAPSAPPAAAPSAPPVAAPSAPPAAAPSAPPAATPSAPPAAAPSAPPAATPGAPSAATVPPVVTPSAGPRGGELTDCLTATELDRLIQPHLHRNYVSAYRLYEIRTNKAPADKLAELLRLRVQEKGWVLAPFHVAHHWATAFFMAKQGAGCSVRVYDSAPSNLTRQHFVDVIRRLGFGDPEIVSHAKQPRDSNECGVHVVWLAAMQNADSPRPHLPEPQQSGREPVVSLARVRNVLVALGGRGLSKRAVSDVLQAAPPLPGANQGGPGPQGGAEASHIPCRIHNPDTACYIIAATQALAHVLRGSPLADDALGAHLAALQGTAKLIQLPTELRNVMQPSPPVRLASLGHQDPEEFLTKAFARWPGTAEAVAVVEHRTTRRADGPSSEETNILPIVPAPLGPDTKSLADSLDAMEAADYTTSPGACIEYRYKPISRAVIFALKRFTNAQTKVAREITVRERFSRGGDTFEVQAVVLHAGASPCSGHYTACVKRGDTWWLLDDADEPKRVLEPQRYLNKAYLVFATVSNGPLSRSSAAHTAPPPAVSLERQVIDVDSGRHTPRDDQMSAAQRRDHDRKQAVFMHTSTVDDYVDNLRNAEDEQVVYFNTADSDLAMQIHAAHLGPDAARKLQILQRRFKSGHTSVWVACVDRHFVTVVFDPHGEVAWLHDSLPSAAPAGVKKLGAALTHVMALLSGTTAELRDAEAPRQAAGSNDCARHALKAAWNRGDGKFAKLPTRDEIVDRAPPPARRHDVSQPWTWNPNDDAVYKITFSVDMNKVITEAAYATWAADVKVALAPTAIKTKNQADAVSVRGLSPKTRMVHALVVARIKGDAVRQAARDVLTAAQTCSAAATVKLSRECTLSTATDRPREEVSEGQLSFATLQPGDRRRQRLARGPKGDSRLPMLVIRVDSAAGYDAVRCPLCEPQRPEASVRCTASSITKSLGPHVKQQHNMCLRVIQFDTCPCVAPDDAAHCRAAVPAMVTSRQGNPHDDATRCATCEAWWPNRSPTARFGGHPCLAPRPGRRTDPWPLEDEVSPPLRERVGLETLSPSPERHYDAGVGLQLPAFRIGEGQHRLPPLAETSVRSLTILANADPDLAPAIVRKAYARETRMQHARTLRALGEAARDAVASEHPATDRQAVPWLIDWIKTKAGAGRWRWSTINTNVVALQSAMNNVQIYVPHVTGGWKLTSDTAWRLLARTARTKAAADVPQQALPATVEQVLKACAMAPPDVAFLLAVTWVTFGRSGALVQLRRQDIVLAPSQDGDVNFTITIMRGKSNRMGQDPHTVQGRLGDFSQFVVPVVERITDPKAFIIPAPSTSHRDNLRAAMKSALRCANNEPRLENRSLRRGSLQTMARAGASIKMLIACSGHSTVKSLKRYLNFGRVATEEQKQVSEIYDALVKTSGTTA